MRAGELRERITIQKEVKEKTETNQNIGSWVDVCTIWAQAVCTESGLRDGDGFNAHTAVWKFYIRRRDDIRAGMRIKWNGRFFLLQGPPVDWKQERNGLTLITTEAV